MATHNPQLISNNTQIDFLLTPFTPTAIIASFNFLMMSWWIWFVQQSVNSIICFRLAMDQLSGLNQLPLNSGDIGSQASGTFSRITAIWSHIPSVMETVWHVIATKTEQIQHYQQREISHIIKMKEICFMIIMQMLLRDSSYELWQDYKNDCCCRVNQVAEAPPTQTLLLANSL